MLHLLHLQFVSVGPQLNLNAGCANSPETPVDRKLANVEIEFKVGRLDLQLFAGTYHFLCHRSVIGLSESKLQELLRRDAGLQFKKINFQGDLEGSRCVFPWISLAHKAGVNAPLGVSLSAHLQALSNKLFPALPPENKRNHFVE